MTDLVLMMLGVVSVITIIVFLLGLYVIWLDSQE